MAYQNLVGQFIYKQPLLRSKFDQLGENDQYLKDNGWQTSVKVVFYQSAVPSGWTQDVSANDRFLRVVNNTGGNPGGAIGGAQSVAAGLSLAHTHTFPSQANHTHAGSTAHSHSFTQGQNASVSPLTSPSPGAWGVGDVFAQFTTNGSSTVGPGLWAASFNSTPLNDVASSSAGTHNHTVNSSLSTINPAYADVIIGVKSTSSGYTDFTSFFNHNDRIRFEPFGATAGLYGNDVYNSDRLTPAGTVAMFFNSVAPSGWSKLTTQNDKALRIVSGAGGGVGGSLGTGQSFSINHNHTNVAAGAHSHTTGNHRHNVAERSPSRTLIAHPSMNGFIFDGSNEARVFNYDGTIQTAVKGRSSLDGGGVSTGINADHTHTVGNSLTNIILAYVDMIQCQKLSTGAPFAFQDLTSTITYKKLVSKQRLDKYAQNDEYIRYHTMPAGAILAHYQSTIPIFWTLVSAQHDRVLRIVSGAGGGSGGSHFISNAITLAHTHTISTYTHSHSYPSHDHDFDAVSIAAGALLSGISSGQSNNVAIEASSRTRGGTINASGTSKILMKTSTLASANTTNDAHNHGGTTSSALSNPTFAYANVILCQKS